MPRQAREIEVGVPMHVTQRGNERKNIFRCDQDKEFYIRNFIFYKKKFRVKLYSWCLMDNHVHFIIEPGTLNGVSKLFSHLNNRYVFYFNSKYQRKGRLFESRYFSCLLGEDHFYEAIRYVELNPLRAKLENTIGGYQWSSAKERLKLRNRYYLSSLPNFMNIQNWNEYLLADDFDDSLWKEIRTKTYSSKTRGEFINS
tara:strand:- start:442 stop:1038 length:597 start_codon:yes stop_codon:yes gene_type:complete